MKLARITVSSGFLVDMMTKGKEFHFRCLEGLPKGTQFVRVTPRNDLHGIDIIVMHESFRDLQDGDIIPELDRPIFERIWNDQSSPDIHRV